jgi:hypothetical protein
MLVSTRTSISERETQRRSLANRKFLPNSHRRDLMRDRHNAKLDSPSRRKQQFALFLASLDFISIAAKAHNASTIINIEWGNNAMRCDFSAFTAAGQHQAREHQ